MASRLSKKMADSAKVCQLLKEYNKILVVAADNVGSNQIQNIRNSLRGESGDSVVVMGKNSVMKRSIMINAEQTGHKGFLKLGPLLVGNVALIFTKGDLNEVGEAVTKYETIEPHLMCTKFLPYPNCSFTRSGQLPLSLMCCHQLSSEADNPLLLRPKFLPHRHCSLIRSRQMLMMSVWAPILLFAGTL